MALQVSYVLFAQDSSWQSQIESAIENEIKNTGIPSLQVAIGIKDTIIFGSAKGYADLENNVLATSETKYRTASVSKWFTATLVFMLAEQGKLDLDMPIQNYCSCFPEKKYSITSRQLLTHTSGIRHYLDYEEALSGSKNAADSLSIKLRQFEAKLGEYTRYTEVETPLNNFKKDSLLFKPGTDWLYSSNGYRLLACVIEGAANKSYTSLMEEMIFQPVGMNQTLADDAWQIIPHRASGYRKERGKPIRRADMRDVSENLPAGGHLSTASDLIRFSMAYYNNVFVSKTAMNDMQMPIFRNSNNTKSESSWRDAIPSKEKYGAGLMLFPRNGIVRYGHSGRQAGASSIVVYNPETKITIAVMSNVKGWNGFISFVNQIEQIVLKASTKNNSN